MNTIIAVTIGVILLGYLLVPVASDVITDIGKMDIENAGIWSSLIGVVVIVTIISLVVVALYSYSSKN